MVLALTLAQMMGGYYDDHMDSSNGIGWAMVAMMIVFAVVLLAGIIWAILHTTRSSNHPGPPTPPAARDLLDQRYARGEIDTADYEERRSKLG